MRLYREKRILKKERKEKMKKRRKYFW